jgi:hypothetical protein
VSVSNTQLNAFWIFVLFCCIFWWNLGLNSGLCACKAGTVLLELHLQVICFGCFGDRISTS